MLMTGAIARIEDGVTEYLVPIATFVCLIAAAAGGGAINVRLPSRHLAEGTIEVVRLALNIFVVMTSVVVGLMLDSARNTLDTNNHNVHALATEIIQLDRILRVLGPDAVEPRRHLLEYVQTALHEDAILEADPQAEACLTKPEPT